MCQPARSQGGRLKQGACGGTERVDLRCAARPNNLDEFGGAVGAVGALDWDLTSEATASPLTAQHAAARAAHAGCLQGEWGNSPELNDDAAKTPAARETDAQER